MKFMRTYEEFRFVDNADIIKEPKTKEILTDKVVDDSVLGGKSSIDGNGVIHIINWKIY